MTERPILMSGPMVRAILAGQKTQTRRVIKPYEPKAGSGAVPPDVVMRRDGFAHRGCPFGQPGDRLWVRENFQPLYAKGYFMEDVDYETGHGYAPAYMATGPVHEYLDHNTDEINDRITPSIFMPRWACRLVLDVKAVRVERLQEISAQDAKAEGVEVIGVAIHAFGPKLYKDYLGHTGAGHPDARRSFQTLWDSLNKKRGFGWATNPWIWVIEFERTGTEQ